MAFVSAGNQNWNPALAGLNAHHGAHDAISHVNAGNYSGSIGTIYTAGNWRVDRQAPTTTHDNIQIQRNGVGSPSTIACLLIPTALSGQIGSIHAAGEDGLRARARYAELTRAIHAGLNLSLRTRWQRPQAPGQQARWEVHVFALSGTFSS